VLYNKLNCENIAENSIGSANIIKLYVYVPSYGDCLLEGSGWNWFGCVEFCSKNKFAKLVHPVGFIIRIYHDARSSECQNVTFIPVSLLVHHLEGALTF